MRGSIPEGYYQWLTSPCGGALFHAKDIGNGMYAGIKPLLFHWTLITGEVGDKWGYTDRWCYADQFAASIALQNWKGEGEPKGWHRHPSSGRRRIDGNPEREYIAP